MRGRRGWSRRRSRWSSRSSEWIDPLQFARPGSQERHANCWVLIAHLQARPATTRLCLALPDSTGDHSRRHAFQAHSHAFQAHSLVLLDARGDFPPSTARLVLQSSALPRNVSQRRI